MTQSAADISHCCVDLRIDDTRWQPLAQQAEQVIILAAAHYIDRICEIGVWLTDNDKIAQLNHEYRGVAQPTNSLSFQAQARAFQAQAGADILPNAPWLLGDIVLAYDIIAEEAAEQNKSHEAHMSHLLVHGLLHLLDYVHDTPADAHRMEAQEIEFLATLDIDNPYEIAPKIESGDVSLA